jgi:hypothetical protein
MVLAGCGQLPGGGAPEPNAASVAVQQADLPNGMVKCDVSGEMDAYLTQVQAKDPTHYTQVKQEWEDAKAKGATAGQVAVYADTTEHCANFKSNTSSITSATYKLVANFVIQFKDEASATNGYRSGGILGFNPTSLTNGGVPSTVGDQTGLGTNSIVVTLDVGGQNFYIAVWQKKKFMVILAVLNIDSATDAKVAAAENGRIK